MMTESVKMPDLADLFPGYASEWINTKSGRIFARVGGKGPPLLLLHGFSETHVMWHRVAPQLVDKFTVIIADLRLLDEDGLALRAEDLSLDLFGAALSLARNTDRRRAGFLPAL